MEAPSLASLAQIGLSVAACALGSPFASIALNMVDDVVNVSQGLIEGTMTWDEAGVNMLRGTASAVAGAYVSDAFGAATAGIENTFGGAVLKTVMGVGSMASKNLVMGSIDAIRYSAGGNFDYDGDYLRESLIGEQALVGYLGGAAATFVTESLGAFTLGLEERDDAGNIFTYKNVTNFETDRIAAMKSFYSLVGNAAQMGVEFAMTGESTVNLLNFNNIANWFEMDWFEGSVGMLEMHIGGDGIDFRMGTGGIDMSIGKIIDSVYGAYSTGLNIDIMNKAAKNAENDDDAWQTATTARGLLDFGVDAEAEETFWNYMSGKDEIHIKEEVEGGGDGFTEYNKERQGRDIFLKRAEKGNIYSLLASGITLQHEAHRNAFGIKEILPDGTVVTEEMNKAETQKAVLAHYAMAESMAEQYGDEIFGATGYLKMDNYVMEQYGEEAFKEYIDKAYDSSDDYLTIKLTDNGINIIDDGENDVYFQYRDSKKYLIKSHDEEKLNEIKKLVLSAMSIMSSGSDKKDEYYELVNKANKLKSEYEKTNKTNIDCSWVIESWFSNENLNIRNINKNNLLITSNNDKPRETLMELLKTAGMKEDYLKWENNFEENLKSYFDNDSELKRYWIRELASKNELTNAIYGDGSISIFDYWGNKDWGKDFNEMGNNFNNDVDYYVDKWNEGYEEGGLWGAFKDSSGIDDIRGWGRILEAATMTFGANSGSAFNELATKAPHIWNSVKIGSSRIAAWLGYGSSAGATAAEIARNSNEAGSKFNLYGQPGPGVTQEQLSALQQYANQTGESIVVHGSRQTGFSFHTGNIFNFATDLDIGVIGNVNNFNNLLMGSWETLPGVTHAPMRIVPTISEALKQGLMVISPQY